MESTDPLGNTGSATYDADLRLTAETGPDNRTSKLSYYPNSNEVRTVTSPTGEVARTGVDLETGDVRYEVDPRNEELRLSGQPYVATVYIRDANGNPTSIQTNRYASDSDPATVDLEAAPFPTYQAQLRKTGYTYGTGGVMASMTDPRGNVTYYSYNTSGYLTKVDSPAGTGETSRRIVTITPNADGSPATDVDARGQRTAYEYDGLGRLTAIRYGTQDGTADFSTTYALDANGNATAMSDKAGSSAWEYDANDALTGESRTQNGLTKSAAYSYSPSGYLSAMTTLEGKTVGYGYDALGRLVSQTDPNDGGRAVAFGYDALSRPTSVTYPSGVSQRLAYGPDDNLKQVLLRKADGTPLQRFDYTYGTDASTGAPTADYWNGFVRSVTELDGSKVAYGYDDLGRLTTAVRTGTSPYDHAYAYDPNDNRTSTTADGKTTTASYDAADQMVALGDAAYSYDRNGNLLAGDGTSYAYDAADKTVKATLASGTILAFGYDGEGRRVWRSVGTARTDYWYDDTGLAFEGGSANTTYLRSPDGELLSRARGAYLANYGLDRLGNVTALTDGQALVNSYTYDPYGREVAATGSYYNPYRYTSTYQDTDTGLYQMGARYYDARSGRFTQQDPLPTSIFEAERYGYTSGNPVNYTDPTGLYPVDANGRRLYPRTHLFGPGRYARGSIRATGSQATRSQRARIQRLGRQYGCHHCGRHVRHYIADHQPATSMKRYYVVERRLYPQCRSCMRAQSRAARTYQSRGTYVRGYRMVRSGGCFSPDTLVTTRAGKKPIRDVKVGDRVLAYDEATGRTAFFPVTAVLRHTSQMIEYLTVEGEHITTTPEHPFYSRKRGWVAAGDLYEGEAVRRGDGSYGQVESIFVIESRQTVFNLTVAIAHTYFVGEGQWLVHNSKRLYTWR